MMPRFRRVLSCLLLSVLLLQASVSAQSTSESQIKEKSIRINNPGARMTAEITGTPGSWVTLELLRPSKEQSEAYKSENMAEIFAGLDMVQIPENGVATYTYSAGEENGIYTLRARGDITSLDYTAEGNVLSGNESDLFFAELWNKSFTHINEDYIQGAVWLSKDLINISLEHAAKTVKAQMDLRKPGRRYLYIDVDIACMPSANSEQFIWEWSAVEEQAAYLDEFFNVYYHLGGELDGIYTDNEVTMCPWAFKSVPEGEDKTTFIWNRLESVVADPTYQNVIRPRLVERGFEFNTTNGNELYDVPYHNSAKDNAYLIWTAVLDTYKSECLTAGIYEPTKKYYPDVYYSNYQSNDRLAGYYTGTAHRYYVGGNRIKAGTHSSPVLYSAGTSKKYAPDGTVSVMEETPFAEMRSLVGGMRNVVISSPDGKTMPWVVSEYYHKFSYIDEDRPYFYEYLLHLGLCDPDAFLHYGPVYYGGEEENVQGNIDGMRNVLEELNAYANKKDAVTLVDDSTYSKYPYVLSGMQTKGRFLWRITPDNTKLEEGQEFCTKEEGTPTFYIDGTTISFPQGKILPNISSTYGYWVETPLDVYPVTVNESETEESSILLKAYDKNGIEVSEENKEDTETVVLFYKGMSGKDIAANIAKYNQGAMTDIKTAEKSKTNNSNGRIVIKNINKEGQQYDEAKLFVWEGFKTLNPILPEVTLKQKTN